MNNAMQDEFRESFFQECHELLESMHENLAITSQQQHDVETIHAIFRAVHSIKGGAAAFNLTNLVSYAHRFETSLDVIRNSHLHISKEILDALQRCGDHLFNEVQAAIEERTLDKVKSENLCLSLEELIGYSPVEEEDNTFEFEPEMIQIEDSYQFTDDENYIDEDHELHFILKLRNDFYIQSNDPLINLRALKSIQEVKIEALIDNVGALSSSPGLTPEIAWKISGKSTETLENILESFEFVFDLYDVTQITSAADLQIAEEPYISEKLKLANDTNDDNTSNFDFTSPDGDGDIPTSTSTSNQNEKLELKRQNVHPKKDRKNITSTIRVDLERVEKLINLVGELVIKEAMLSQSINELKLPSESQVSADLDSLKQLASEIQEGVMSIRAQPIKPIFQRMERTVRDCSHSTGKSVRFISQGENTEIDKTVLERLIDPLNHMIRNAVDHGIEEPSIRRISKKPEEGTITLTATHRSGRVVIEVHDDGAGVDRERVLSIAKAKGLVPTGVEITDAEIDNLLFAPGFSSKLEVSELSGRGVGLDVAKNEILALGGRLSLTSKPGLGSTFTISMPLTLAVLEGMIVSVNNEIMVVPISSIQETIQLSSDNLHMIGPENRFLSTKNGLIPIVDLGVAFGFRSFPKNPNTGILLIIDTESHKRCALLVDFIQDQRQVVIKSLETNYQRIYGISAATILGDGRIALIVDPENIFSKSSGSLPSPQTARL